MKSKTFKLKDILINYDYLRKPLSSMERENFQGEFPYYGAQGIIDHVKEYVCDGTYMLIAEDGENLSSRKAPIANIATGKFWVNNHAHIVRTNEKADFRYIYYLLNSSDITGYVTGSAQPKLSQGSLNKIKIELPDIKIQEKISTILSRYDEAIENNNKRIKLLEQMAQNLYKEWFVRFRFPGWQNAEFENGIPSIWHQGSLSELLEFKRGKNITADEMVEGNVPVISAGLEPSGFHIAANVNGASITVSSSGANAGYLSIHYEDIWAADCMFISEKKTKNIFYVYELLNNIRPVISNLQRGAAQPHVYSEDINKLRLYIPDEALMEKANKILEKFHKEINQLQKKNQNLTKQRDLLLPRLMSGKLDVK